LRCLCPRRCSGFRRSLGLWHRRRHYRRVRLGCQGPWSGQTALFATGIFAWHVRLAHESQGHPAPANSEDSFDRHHGQDARGTHGQDGHATDAHATTARRSRHGACRSPSDMARGGRRACPFAGWRSGPAGLALWRPGWPGSPGRPGR